MSSSAVCNIGLAEVRYRRRIGYAGLVLSILFILGVFLLELPRSYRLGLVLPAGIAFAGFLQARAGFCVAYGMQGVTSLEGFRRLSPDSDPAGARRRSIRLLGAIALGAIGAALFFFLVG